MSGNVQGGQGRVLGLDFGSKTVGVAVSDPLLITAQPLMTVTRQRESKLRQTLARIEETASSYQVSVIVLGFPKNMDNTLGERSEKTLAFKEMLEKRTGLPVVLQDERLSTVEASRALSEGGVSGRHERKSRVDAVAASIILQSYLDALNDR